MKRSEINLILEGAKRFLAEHKFHLPPFAAWTPGDWKQRGADTASFFLTVTTCSQSTCAGAQ